MPEHVVIAGGGVGALEGMLALQHLAPDSVDISVLTAARHVTYRALSVAEPFGGEPAPRYDWEQITHDRGVRWIPDVVQAVRPRARELDTRDGPPVGYDALLLALGARPEPALPGAITFAGPRDVLEIREAIEALAPGGRHEILFVAPAGVAWTLPLYELALMTAQYGRRAGLDLRLEVVTRESDPLGVFGGAASAAVADRLAAAGIGLRTGAFAQEYAEAKLWLELEGPLDADLVIALPRLHGPAARGPARRRRRLRPGRSVRPRARRGPRLGGRRHDEPAAQAGRPRRAAGRRRRGGDRRAAGRPRRATAPVPAQAPGHAPDRRGPAVPGAPSARAAVLGGLPGLPVVAGAEDRRPPSRSVPRVARRADGAPSLSGLPLAQLPAAGEPAGPSRGARDARARALRLPAPEDVHDQPQPSLAGGQPSGIEVAPDRDVHGCQ